MPNICIITGAAAGIGFALAKACVARGDAVIMADIDALNVKKMADRLTGLGSGFARGVQLDVTCAADIEGVIKRRWLNTVKLITFSIMLELPYRVKSGTWS